MKKTTKSTKKSVKKISKSDFVSLGKNQLILAAVLIGMLLVGGIYYFTQSSDYDLVIVNGKAITSSEFEGRYALLASISPGNLASREVFIKQLVDEQLLYQEALKKGISPSEEEIDVSITELLAQGGFTEEIFSGQLTEAGVSFDSFKAYYEINLAVRQYLESYATENVEVKSTDILDYYQDNIEKFTAQEGQIRARHILVETEEEAQDLRVELLTGGDFALLANEKSIGPSGPHGGELGFFSTGQMVKPFEDVVFNLRVNQISDPVETQFGWHIIQRLSNKVQYEDIKESLNSTVTGQKEQQVIISHLDNLREESTIVYFENK